mmetsp:Transcript_24525/g.70952  ORF Transcript_24525/g.70952 Transcript_24525/m.70952 type:complete len:260 (-) Transcript_24525:1013-1792(-)
MSGHCQVKLLANRSGKRRTRAHGVLVLARHYQVVLHHGRGPHDLQDVAHLPQCVVGLDELGHVGLELLADMWSNICHGQLLVHAAAGSRSNHLPFRWHRHVRPEQVPVWLLGRLHHQYRSVLRDEDDRMHLAAERHRRATRRSCLDPSRRGHPYCPDPCDRERLEAAGALSGQVHDPVRRSGLADICFGRDLEAVLVAVPARDMPDHPVHRPDGIDRQFLSEAQRERGVAAHREPHAVFDDSSLGGLLSWDRLGHPGRV